MIINQLLKNLLDCVKTKTLLLNGIAYSIGAGIVSYIGKPISADCFWMGLSLVIVFKISAGLLVCYYQPQDNEKQVSSQQLNEIRKFILALSFVFLTLATVLIVLLFNATNQNISFLILAALQFSITIFLAVPPFAFVKKGFGDLIAAIEIISISAYLGNILQYGSIHRVLFLITFPAFFLLIAHYIALSIENYSSDLKTGKRSLVTNLGWQFCMKIHNYFILTTFLLYGIASILGLAGILTLPVLFAFPLAAVQLWEMWRIGEGYKPRWQLLRFTSAAGLSILSYFYLYFLWLR